MSFPQQTGSSGSYDPHDSSVGHSSTINRLLSNTPTSSRRPPSNQTSLTLTKRVVASSTPSESRLQMFSDGDQQSTSVSTEKEKSKGSEDGSSSASPTAKPDRYHGALATTTPSSSSVSAPPSGDGFESVQIDEDVFPSSSGSSVVVSATFLGTRGSSSVVWSQNDFGMQSVDSVLSSTIVDDDDEPPRLQQQQQQQLRAPSDEKGSELVKTSPTPPLQLPSATASEVRSSPITSRPNNNSKVTAATSTSTTTTSTTRLVTSVPGTQKKRIPSLDEPQCSADPHDLNGESSTRSASSTPPLPTEASHCAITSTATTTATTSASVNIDFSRMEVIGRGTFGVVYRAMDIDTNRIVAVKEIILQQHGAGGSGGNAAAMKKQIDRIQREIDLLTKLNHPNVVTCLGSRVEGDRFFILMEYISGGTIRSMLKSFGPLRESQASLYTRQILEGLRYIHLRRIAHRDLKGDNLLVDVSGAIKLGDFGAAKELETLTKTVTGTAQFMAPEVVKGIGHGMEADIWSLGCCVVEMITGQPPFMSLGKNPFSIMAKVAVMDRPPLPNDVSEECAAFLRKCLVPDPKQRATCDELLQMDWIMAPPQRAPSALAAATSPAGKEDDDDDDEEEEEEGRSDTFNPIVSVDAFEGDSSSWLQ